MKAIIVITFAFMAVAFYQLSGGANFEPRGLRPAPQQTAAASRPAPAPRAKTAAAGRVEATALVARPVLQPRRPDPEPAPETAALTPEQQAQQDKTRLDQLRSGLGPALSDFPAQGDAGALTLASLASGAQGLRVAPSEEDESAETAPQPEQPQPDIREVTGTRVNMRDGPGTIYPVIRRLTIGQEVEVLSESGTGWLRLRTMPDRQIGWIAASLISKRAR